MSEARDVLREALLELSASSKMQMMHRRKIRKRTYFLLRAAGLGYFDAKGKVKGISRAAPRLAEWDDKAAEAVLDALDA